MSRGLPVLGVPRLDQLSAPTADVSMNSHKITNLAAPASANDAARKVYVDDAIAAISAVVLFFPVSGAWTVEAGTWSLGSNSALYGNFATHSNADKISCKFKVFETGTYHLRLIQATGDNHPKYDVLLDDVKKGNTQDQYADPAVAFDYSDDISLGTLTAGTTYELTLIVNGKNSSSTDYYATFYSVRLEKVA